MKLSILSALVLASIFFTSCKKCADCSCTGNNDFDFPADMPQADQDFIVDQYTQNYEDKSSELCEKRGDYDDAVTAYESGGTSFEEDQTYNGFDWSLDASYDCVCTEQ